MKTCKKPFVDKYRYNTYSACQVLSITPGQLEHMEKCGKVIRHPSSTKRVKYYYRAEIDRIAQETMLSIPGDLGQKSQEHQGIDYGFLNYIEYLKSYCPAPQEWDFISALNKMRDLAVTPNEPFGSRAFYAAREIFRNLLIAAYTRLYKEYSSNKGSN